MYNCITQTMGTFLDAIIILGIMVMFVRLGASGEISVEITAVMMTALVALVGVARAIGSGLISLVFRISLPIAAVAFLVVSMSGGDPRAIVRAIVALGALFIALLGFYIMFRSAFRGKK